MRRRGLREVLDAWHIRYEILKHSAAVSAQPVQRTHFYGWRLAKGVVAGAVGRLIMLVIPAPLHLDISKVRRLCAGALIDLVPEYDVRHLFPDADLGAIPPFGKLYGLPVIVDRRLAAQESLVFRTGSHAELLRLRFDDYCRFVEPIIADIARVAAPNGPEVRG